jgi:CheY-like chemotaxis protein
MQDVLVIEDDADARRLVSTCLARLGVRVREAATRAEALERLGEGTPDLVCLDVNLPDGNGLEICHRMRGTPHLSEVPVLVISGSAEVPDRAYAELAGATDFLAKPFRCATLQQSAADLLANSAVGAS